MDDGSRGVPGAIQKARAQEAALQAAEQADTALPAPQVKNKDVLNAMPRRARRAWFSVTRRGGTPDEAMEAAKLAIKR